MWIFKDSYEELNRKIKMLEIDVEFYKESYKSAAIEALKYKQEYEELKEKIPLKLYEVSIYLKLLEPITYNIETISPDEAEAIAVKKFKDNNKDIPASNIVMITVEPICKKER